MMTKLVQPRRAEVRDDPVMIQPLPCFRKDDTILHGTVGSDAAAAVLVLVVFTLSLQMDISRLSCLDNTHKEVHYKVFSICISSN